MAYELLNASGGGGTSATPAQIWEYANRTLTESAGLSTEEHNKLFSLENSTGGGYRNGSEFNAQDRKLLKDAHEKVMTLENTDNQKLEKKLDEIDSHIFLAKDETIDIVKEIETEICSDIVRSKKEIQKDNVATRQLVRQKTKNLAELAQKQLDSDAKDTAMIESITQEFQQQENEEKEIHDEFDKQEMDEIVAEFEKQEKETKQP